MNCSVIVPAYQAAPVLPRCLRALQQQSLARDRYEIIVVDDGSTDGTADIAEQVLRNQAAQVIRLPHGGPAWARNAGAQAARGELVLFTDADCEPTPDWLEQLTRVFDDASISGAKGIYCTRQRSLIARFIQQEYLDRYDRLPHLSSIDFVDTYSAAYRRSVFLANGGFSTAFPTASVEDQEFSFRLTRRGHRLVFVSDAIVCHQHNTTLPQYFRRKYKIGYWKVAVLQQHPGKARSDSHTPQIVKVQIALLFAVLLITVSALWRPIDPLIPIGLWASFGITMLPLLRKIARRDKPVLSIAPVLIATRALALGLGLLIGAVKILPRRSPPSEAV